MIAADTTTAALHRPTERIYFCISAGNPMRDGREEKKKEEEEEEECYIRTTVSLSLGCGISCPRDPTRDDLCLIALKRQLDGRMCSTSNVSANASNLRYYSDET